MADDVRGEGERGRLEEMAPRVAQVASQLVPFLAPRELTRNVNRGEDGALTPRSVKASVASGWVSPSRLSK